MWHVQQIQHAHPTRILHVTMVFINTITVAKSALKIPKPVPMMALPVKTATTGQATNANNARGSVLQHVRPMVQHPVMLDIISVRIRVWHVLPIQHAHPTRILHVIMVFINPMAVAYLPLFRLPLDDCTQKAYSMQMPIFPLLYMCSPFAGLHHLLPPHTYVRYTY